MKPYLFTRLKLASAVDQADVRAFRRLDRADPAIMGRVDVADLEARALAGEAARPERRDAALVRHFGERVGLVHELRELRRAEELAHRGDRGLGVDQVVRHDGRDVDRATCAPSRRAPCGAGRRDTGSRAARRPSARGGCRDCRYRRSRPCRPSGSTSVFTTATMSSLRSVVTRVLGVEARGAC